jgi:hypothetical protein
MSISPLHDAETLRQQRNLTNAQKRTTGETKEGVLVNNFINVFCVYKNYINTINK